MKTDSGSFKDRDIFMGLTEQIRDAGVVGCGGAGFPADRKLDCNAEIFIINGIECEPLLRTDRFLMEQNAQQIVQTAKALKEHLGAFRTVIAVKKHYADAVNKLKEALTGTDIELYLSDSFYPAGDEQNLVFSITGRCVPTGGIPLDVGCVVSNVSTVMNIANAMKDIPVTTKSVTVSGCVKQPMVVECPIGTPLSQLIEAAGGTQGKCEYILGGPLMGSIITDLSMPVTKTTGGLLAVPEGHRLLSLKAFNDADRKLAQAACSQCSMCTQMCPRNAMGLNVQPHKAMRAYGSGNEGLLQDVNGIFSCCDCGVCTYYACNFGLKPGKVMQQMKQMLSQQNIKPVKEVRYKPDAGIANKRIPVNRLMMRLCLSDLDRDVINGGSISCSHVKIPLKMHIGAACEPVVRVGMSVNKGEPVAKPRGLGAVIHASVTGKIVNITDDHIEIKE